MKPNPLPVAYSAFWFGLGLPAARLLGIRGARGLGRLLGELYALTHPHTRAAVRTNLSLICNSGEQRRLVHRVFRNFGATLADYFQLGIPSVDAGRQLVATRRGLEHIQTALAQGRGALVVTIHTGLFELGGLVMSEYRFPLAVLSLPEPDPALNQWRAAYRRRWGTETVEVGGDQFSFAGIAAQLAQGKCVAMLVDRPYRDDDAVLVDFPHGRIPFSTGPVWLSLLAGAPLVPTTILARPDGKYELEAQAPIFPRWHGADRVATVQEYTVTLAARFRDALCQHPDQWYQFVPLLS